MVERTRGARRDEDWEGLFGIHQMTAFRWLLLGRQRAVRRGCSEIVNRPFSEGDWMKKKPLWRMALWAPESGGRQRRTSSRVVGTCVVVNYFSAIKPSTPTICSHTPSLLLHSASSSLLHNITRPSFIVCQSDLCRFPNTPLPTSLPFFRLAVVLFVFAGWKSKSRL